MSDDLVGEVAPAQRFDEAKLKAYLEGQIEGFGKNLFVQQIKGGASNPTFKLTTARSKRTACAMCCARNRRASCSPARTRSTANIA